MWSKKYSCLVVIYIRLLYTVEQYERWAFHTVFEDCMEKIFFPTQMLCQLVPILSAFTQTCFSPDKAPQRIDYNDNNNQRPNDSVGHIVTFVLIRNN